MVLDKRGYVKACLYSSEYINYEAVISADAEWQLRSFT